MAFADWDNVTSITREKIFPQVVNQISSYTAALFRILKLHEFGAGTSIDLPVQYRLSTQGGWYSGLDTLDTSQEPTRTRATWSHCYTHQPIVIANTDVAANAGTEQVVAMIAQDTQEAKDALQDKMATALFTAKTGLAMDSLVDGCDDASNVSTYGGIDRSTYTWFKGNYNGSGGTLAWSTIATELASAESGSEKVTIHLTTQTLWNALEALYQPTIRTQFTQAGYPKGEGGFEQLTFRGVPVQADDYCTAGYWYGLNEKWWKVVGKKHPDFPTDNMGFTMTDLRTPSAQDGKVGFLLWWGNLICTQPRRQFVIRGLS